MSNDSWGNGADRVVVGGSNKDEEHYIVIIQLMRRPPMSLPVFEHLGTFGFISKVTHSADTHAN